MTKGRIVTAVIAALVLVYAGFTATIVKEGQEATLTGEVAFDPTTEATNFWKEKSKAYFDENAVDLTTLIEESQGDFASVASKYGHYSMGDKGELSFIVKGTATVKTIKTKLRAGYLGVSVDGIPDDYQLRIQVGPVFKGSAVRDSISLISYKDYKNQIEWAQVSVAFHDLILKQILSPIDLNATEGKQLDFIGCFTVARKGLIQITPVKLELK